MRLSSGWFLAAFLMALLIAAGQFYPGRAGDSHTLFLPLIEREEPVDLSVPQVVKTVVLPDSLCLNAVGHNQVTDTWYVADHHKVHNGLYYDKHNGRVNVLRNHELVAHVVVGGRPTAFAADPQSGFTYLTSLPEPYPPGRGGEGRRACGNPTAEGWDPACINVFDGAALLRQYDPHYEPFDIAVHPITRRFYASDIDSWFYTGFGANDFGKYPLDFQPEPGTSIWGLSIAIHPHTGRVYLSTWEYPWIYMIEGDSVTGVIRVDGWGMREIALDHLRGLIYTANTETHVPGRPSNNITVININTMEQRAFTTGSKSHTVAIHYGSGLAYVLNASDGTVSVLRNGDFLHNVAVGNNPRALDINQRTGYVFVALEDDNEVAVLREGALVTTLPTGNKPFALHTDSESGYTYIANRNWEIRYDGLNRPFEFCLPDPTVTVVR